MNIPNLRISLNRYYYYGENWLFSDIKTDKFNICKDIEEEKDIYKVCQKHEKIDKTYTISDYRIKNILKDDIYYKINPEWSYYNNNYINSFNTLNISDNTDYNDDAEFFTNDGHIAHTEKHAKFYDISNYIKYKNNDNNKYFWVLNYKIDFDTSPDNFDYYICVNTKEYYIKDNKITHILDSNFQTEHISNSLIINTDPDKDINSYFNRILYPDLKFYNLTSNDQTVNINEITTTIQPKPKDFVQILHKVSNLTNKYYSKTIKKDIKIKLKTEQIIYFKLPENTNIIYKDENGIDKEPISNISDYPYSINVSNTNQEIIIISIIFSDIDMFSNQNISKDVIINYSATDITLKYEFFKKNGSYIEYEYLENKILPKFNQLNKDFNIEDCSISLSNKKQLYFSGYQYCKENYILCKDFYSSISYEMDVNESSKNTNIQYFKINYLYEFYPNDGSISTRSLSKSELIKFYKYSVHKHNISPTYFLYINHRGKMYVIDRNKSSLNYTGDSTFNTEYEIFYDDTIDIYAFYNGSIIQLIYDKDDNKTIEVYQVDKKHLFEIDESIYCSDSYIKYNNNGIKIYSSLTNIEITNPDPIDIKSYNYIVKNPSLIPEDCENLDIVNIGYDLIDCNINTKISISYITSSIKFLIRKTENKNLWITQFGSLKTKIFKIQPEPPSNINVLYNNYFSSDGYYFYQKLCFFKKSDGNEIEYRAFPAGIDLYSITYDYEGSDAELAIDPYDYYIGKIDNMWKWKYNTTRVYNITTDPVVTDSTKTQFTHHISDYNNTRYKLYSFEHLDYLYFDNDVNYKAVKHTQGWVFYDEEGYIFRGTNYDKTYFTIKPTPPPGITEFYIFKNKYYSYYSNVFYLYTIPEIKIPNYVTNLFLKQLVINGTYQNRFHYKPPYSDIYSYSVIEKSSRYSKTVFPQKKFLEDNENPELYDIRSDSIDNMEDFYINKPLKHEDAENYVLYFYGKNCINRSFNITLYSHIYDNKRTDDIDFDTVTFDDYILGHDYLDYDSIINRFTDINKTININSYSNSHHSEIDTHFKSPKLVFNTTRNNTDYSINDIKLIKYEDDKNDYEDHKNVQIKSYNNSSDIGYDILNEISTIDIHYNFKYESDYSEQNNIMYFKNTIIGAGKNSIKFRFKNCRNTNNSDNYLFNNEKLIYIRIYYPPNHENVININGFTLYSVYPGGTTENNKDTEGHKRIKNLTYVKKTGSIWKSNTDETVFIYPNPNNGIYKLVRKTDNGFFYTINYMYDDTLFLKNVKHNLTESNKTYSEYEFKISEYLKFRNIMKFKSINTYEYCASQENTNYIKEKYNNLELTKYNVYELAEGSLSIDGSYVFFMNKLVGGHEFKWISNYDIFELNSYADSDGNIIDLTDGQEFIETYVTKDIITVANKSDISETYDLLNHRDEKTVNLKKKIDGTFSVEYNLHPSCFFTYENKFLLYKYSTNDKKYRLFDSQTNSETSNFNIKPVFKKSLNLHNFKYIKTFKDISLLKPVDKKFIDDNQISKIKLSNRSLNKINCFKKNGYQLTNVFMYTTDFYMDKMTTSEFYFRSDSPKYWVFFDKEDADNTRSDYILPTASEEVIQLSDANSLDAHYCFGLYDNQEDYIKDRIGLLNPKCFYVSFSDYKDSLVSDNGYGYLPIVTDDNGDFKCLIENQYRNVIIKPDICRDTIRELKNNKLKIKPVVQRVTSASTGHYEWYDSSDVNIDYLYRHPNYVWKTYPYCHDVMYPHLVVTADLSEGHQQYYSCIKKVYESFQVRYNDSKLRSNGALANKTIKRYGRNTFYYNDERLDIKRSSQRNSSFNKNYTSLYDASDTVTNGFTKEEFDNYWREYTTDSNEQFIMYRFKFYTYTVTRCGLKNEEVNTDHWDHLKQSYEQFYQYKLVQKPFLRTMAPNPSSVSKQVYSKQYFTAKPNTYPMDSDYTGTDYVSTKHNNIYLEGTTWRYSLTKGNVIWEDDSPIPGDGIDHIERFYSTEGRFTYQYGEKKHIFNFSKRCKDNKLGNITHTTSKTQITDLSNQYRPPSVTNGGTMCYMLPHIHSYTESDGNIIELSKSSYINRFKNGFYYNSNNKLKNISSQKKLFSCRNKTINKDRLYYQDVKSNHVFHTIIVGNFDSAKEIEYENSSLLDTSDYVKIANNSDFQKKFISYNEQTESIKIVFKRGNSLIQFREYMDIGISKIEYKTNTQLWTSFPVDILGSNITPHYVEGEKIKDQYYPTRDITINHFNTSKTSFLKIYTGTEINNIKSYFYVFNDEPYVLYNDMKVRISSGYTYGTLSDVIYETLNAKISDIVGNKIEKDTDTYSQDIAKFHNNGINYIGIINTDENLTNTYIAGAGDDFEYDSSLSSNTDASFNISLHKRQSYLDDESINEVTRTSNVEKPWRTNNGLDFYISPVVGSGINKLYKYGINGQFIESFQDNDIILENINEFSCSDNTDDMVTYLYPQDEGTTLRIIDEHKQTIYQKWKDTQTSEIYYIKGLKFYDFNNDDLTIKTEYYDETPSNSLMVNRLYIKNEHKYNNNDRNNLHFINFNINESETIETLTSEYEIQFLNKKTPNRETDDNYISNYESYKHVLYSNSDLSPDSIVQNANRVVYNDTNWVAIDDHGNEQTVYISPLPPISLYELSTKAPNGNFLGIYNIGNDYFTNSIDYEKIKYFKFFRDNIESYTPAETLDSNSTIIYKTNTKEIKNEDGNIEKILHTLDLNLLVNIEPQLSTNKSFFIVKKQKDSSTIDISSLQYSRIDTDDFPKKIAYFNEETDIIEAIYFNDLKSVIYNINDLFINFYYIETDDNHYNKNINYGIYKQNTNNIINNKEIILLKDSDELLRDTTGNWYIKEPDDKYTYTDIVVLPIPDSNINNLQLNNDINKLSYVDIPCESLIYKKTDDNIPNNNEESLDSSVIDKVLDTQFIHMNDNTSNILLQNIVRNYDMTIIRSGLKKTTIPYNSLDNISLLKYDLNDYDSYKLVTNITSLIQHVTGFKRHGQDNLYLVDIEDKYKTIYVKESQNVQINYSVNVGHIKNKTNIYDSGFNSLENERNNINSLDFYISYIYDGAEERDGEMYYKYISSEKEAHKYCILENYESLDNYPIRISRDQLLYYNVYKIQRHTPIYLIKDTEYNDFWMYDTTRYIVYNIEKEIKDQATQLIKKDIKLLPNDISITQKIQEKSISVTKSNSLELFDKYMRNLNNIFSNFYDLDNSHIDNIHGNRYGTHLKKKEDVSTILHKRHTMYYDTGFSKIVTTKLPIITGGYSTFILKRLSDNVQAISSDYESYTHFYVDNNNEGSGRLYNNITENYSTTIYYPYGGTDRLYLLKKLYYKKTNNEDEPRFKIDVPEDIPFTRIDAKNTWKFLNVSYYTHNTIVIPECINRLHVINKYIIYITELNNIDKKQYYKVFYHFDDINAGDSDQDWNDWRVRSNLHALYEGSGITYENRNMDSTIQIIERDLCTKLVYSESEKNWRINGGQRHNQIISILPDPNKTTHELTDQSGADWLSYQFRSNINTKIKHNLVRYVNDYKHYKYQYWIDPGEIDNPKTKFTVIPEPPPFVRILYYDHKNPGFVYSKNYSINNCLLFTNTDISLSLYNSRLFNDINKMDVKYLNSLQPLNSNFKYVGSSTSNTLRKKQYFIYKDPEFIYKLAHTPQYYILNFQGNITNIYGYTVSKWIHGSVYYYTQEVPDSCKLLILYTRSSNISYGIYYGINDHKYINNSGSEYSYINNNLYGMSCNTIVKFNGNLYSDFSDIYMRDLTYNTFVTNIDANSISYSYDSIAPVLNSLFILSDYNVDYLPDVIERFIYSIYPPSTTESNKGSLGHERITDCNDIGIIDFKTCKVTNATSDYKDKHCCIIPNIRLGSNYSNITHVSNGYFCETHHVSSWYDNSGNLYYLIDHYNIDYSITKLYRVLKYYYITETQKNKNFIEYNENGRLSHLFNYEQSSYERFHNTYIIKTQKLVDDSNYFSNIEKINLNLKQFSKYDYEDYNDYNVINNTIIKTVDNKYTNIYKTENRYGTSIRGSLQLFDDIIIKKTGDIFSIYYDKKILKDSERNIMRNFMTIPIEEDYNGEKNLNIRTECCFIKFVAITKKKMNNELQLQIIFKNKNLNLKNYNNNIWNTCGYRVGILNFNSKWEHTNLSYQPNNGEIIDVINGVGKDKYSTTIKFISRVDEHTIPTCDAFIFISENLTNYNTKTEFDSEFSDGGYWKELYYIKNNSNGKILTSNNHIKIINLNTTNFNIFADNRNFLDDYIYSSFSIIIIRPPLLQMHYFKFGSLLTDIIECELEIKLVESSKKESSKKESSKKISKYNNKYNLFFYTNRYSSIYETSKKQYTNKFEKRFTNDNTYTSEANSPIRYYYNTTPTSDTIYKIAQNLSYNSIQTDSFFSNSDTIYDIKEYCNINDGIGKTIFKMSVPYCISRKTNTVQYTIEFISYIGGEIVKNNTEDIFKVRWLGNNQVEDIYGNKHYCIITNHLGNQYNSQRSTITDRADISYFFRYKDDTEDYWTTMKCYYTIYDIGLYNIYPRKNNMSSLFNIGQFWYECINEPSITYLTRLKNNVYENTECNKFKIPSLDNTNIDVVKILKNHNRFINPITNDNITSYSDNLYNNYNYLYKNTQSEEIYWTDELYFSNNHDTWDNHNDRDESIHTLKCNYNGEIPVYDSSSITFTDRGKWIIHGGVYNGYLGTLEHRNPFQYMSQYKIFSDEHHTHQIMDSYIIRIEYTNNWYNNNVYTRKETWVALTKINPKRGSEVYLSPNPHSTDIIFYPTNFNYGFHFEIELKLLENGLYQSTKNYIKLSDNKFYKVPNNFYKSSIYPSKIQTGFSQLRKKYTSDDQGADRSIQLDLFSTNDLKPPKYGDNYFIKNVNTVNYYCVNISTINSFEVIMNLDGKSTSYVIENNISDEYKHININKISYQLFLKNNKINYFTEYKFYTDKFKKPYYIPAICSYLTKIDDDTLLLQDSNFGEISIDDTFIIRDPTDYNTFEYPNYLYRSKGLNYVSNYGYGYEFYAGNKYNTLTPVLKFERLDWDENDEKLYIYKNYYGEEGIGYNVLYKKHKIMYGKNRYTDIFVDELSAGNDIKDEAEYTFELERHIHNSSVAYKDYGFKTDNDPFYKSYNFSLYRWTKPIEYRLFYMDENNNFIKINMFDLYGRIITITKTNQVHGSMETCSLACFCEHGKHYIQLGDYSNIFKFDDTRGTYTKTMINMDEYTRVINLDKIVVVGVYRNIYIHTNASSHLTLTNPSTYFFIDESSINKSELIYDTDLSLKYDEVKYTSRHQEAVYSQMSSNNSPYFIVKERSCETWSSSSGNKLVYVEYITSLEWYNNYLANDTIIKIGNKWYLEGFSEYDNFEFFINQNIPSSIKQLTISSNALCFYENYYTTLHHNIHELFDMSIVYYKNTDFLRNINKLDGEIDYEQIAPIVWGSQFNLTNSKISDTTDYTFDIIYERIHPTLGTYIENIVIGKIHGRLREHYRYSPNPTSSNRNPTGGRLKFDLDGYLVKVDSVLSSSNVKIKKENVGGYSIKPGYKTTNGLYLYDNFNRTYAGNSPNFLIPAFDVERNIIKLGSDCTNYNINFDTFITHGSIFPTHFFLTTKFDDIYINTVNDKSHIVFKTTDDKIYSCGDEDLSINNIFDIYDRNISNKIVEITDDKYNMSYGNFFLNNNISDPTFITVYDSISNNAISSLCYVDSIGSSNLYYIDFIDTRYIVGSGYKLLKDVNIIFNIKTNIHDEIVSTDSGKIYFTVLPLESVKIKLYSNIEINISPGEFNEINFETNSNNESTYKELDRKQTIYECTNNYLSTIISKYISDKKYIKLKIVSVDKTFNNLYHNSWKILEPNYKRIIFETNTINIDYFKNETIYVGYKLGFCPDINDQINIKFFTKNFTTEGFDTLIDISPVGKNIYFNRNDWWIKNYIQIITKYVINTNIKELDEKTKMGFSFNICYEMKINNNVIFGTDNIIEVIYPKYEYVKPDVKFKFTN
tara:strand:- start:7063 stop:24942 length:17880 start_codon:yes stop_codon:yes gene_type:complete